MPLKDRIIASAGWRPREALIFGLAMATTIAALKFIGAVLAAASRYYS